MSGSPGKLYLVPTPIGNLEDITHRAQAVLREVDIIACEDTRHSRRLLDHLEIRKPLISYHDFNEESRSRQLVDDIRQGKSVALISDAGSPGISDPAYRIVKRAIELDLEIVPLPGPTAVIPALTASGLPTDRFFFEGFLPHKSGARATRLKVLAEFDHTIVFYESPHRIEKSLTAMHDILGDRPACLAREISKKFEQFLRGNLSEIVGKLQGRSVKGEIVVVVSGAAYWHKLQREQERDGQ